MINKKAMICVDDEKFVLASLKHELENDFGTEYLIEEAISGEDALEIVSELMEDGYEVPVTIVDYIMPGMKGDELLELIHKKSPDTKNIMLTGQARTEGIKYAVNKADLYRFLTKPWDKNDIIMTVNEAIKSYNLKKTIEQKRIELETAYKKLKKLDVSKNYFLGLLSHEINTPISGIKGFTEFIRESVTSPELKEYCDFIMLSTDKLRKFSNYSLTITKLLNEKYELNISNENIYSIVSESIQKINDKAREKNIELVKNYKFDDAYIEVDYNLVTKTFEIILDNAVKFSSENKEIILQDSKNDEYYTISILDEGPGFTKETMENLYEFFVSDELMSHSEGLGLGLAMAKIIMNVHGGDITVKNRDGDGHGAEVSLSFKL